MHTNNLYIITLNIDLENEEREIELIKEKRQKCQLDLPKRMIERRERERYVRNIERESERETHRALPYVGCALS